MSYTVIIRKNELKDVPEKEYVEVGEKPDGSKRYDHVTVHNQKEVSTEIFNQRVESLNVTEVIKAVNGLESMVSA